MEEVEQQLELDLKGVEDITNIDILDVIHDGITNGTIGLATLFNTETESETLVLVGKEGEGYLPLAELITAESVSNYHWPN